MRVPWHPTPGESPDLTTLGSRMAQVDGRERASAIVRRCFGVEATLEQISDLNNEVYRLQVGREGKILKVAKGRDGAALKKELMLFELLRRHDVPTPTVEQADPDGRMVGTPFVVMKSAGDRTVADWIGAPGDSAGRLFEEMGAIHARIHGITFPESGEIHEAAIVPIDPRGFLGPLHQSAGALVDEGLLERDEAEGFRALPIPPIHGFSLCHGDFHAVQCIVGTERIRAVVDWESAWAGNAAIDVAFTQAYLEFYASLDHTARYLDGYRALRPLPPDYSVSYLPARMALLLVLLTTWRRLGPQVWEQACGDQRVSRVLSLFRSYLARSTGHPQ